MADEMNPYAMMSGQGTDTSGIASGIANTAVGLYKFVQGIKQQKQYNEMIKKLVNPIYEIPTEATNALNLSKSLAEPKTFAGQTQAEQKIDQSVAKAGAQAIRSAASPQDLLGAITEINANEMDAKNDLMMKAADDYLNRKKNLISAENNYATYQAEKQDRDIYDRFYRDSAAASAMREGAMRNKFGGFEQSIYGLGKTATSVLPAVTGIPV